MPRHAFLVTVLLASTSGLPAWAGDAAVLPGESRTTATRLAEVRKKIDDKKYVEAIDDLQAILETAGNDLVPLTPERCVQARRLCHRELARLPSEALLEYRARVEPQAKKWLDEATPTRDRRLLRRVVDEAFCSRSGETAVDLLGELAFERGCFDEAIAWWSLLAPSLDMKKGVGEDAALVYPDVQGDKARLYAKQIVALFFAGATEKAKHELKAFQKAFPNAEGELTEQKGKYADLLEALVKQTPTTDPGKTWTTFGGDATRGLVLPAPQRWLEHLTSAVKEGPTWRFDLEKRAPLDDSSLPVPGKGESATVRARSLAFHPLICGPYVIVSDAQFVTAYDLRTGKATQWFDVAALNALATPNLKLPVPNGQPTDQLDLRDLRYTLTAADGCVYVRLGAQTVFHPDEIDGIDPDGIKAKKRDERIASFIACLSLEPTTERKRVRWCMRPVVVPGKPEWEQRGAIFEGAPIVHNGLLYAAVTWFEGDRTVTAIQCYPAGTEALPQKRWQQTVCETRELKSKEQRARHQLLTIAGPNVVYCSHSGAIVAVDALTGKTAWAVRYPSQPPTNADEPSLRDLTPCVYAAGRLYAAPADYDHLLCLDPLTGETLWDREHLAATHLLGVGQDRLIFTTLAGLHAVNAADGGYTDGWFLPGGGGKIAPMGRGFLIGAVVVWPTDQVDMDSGLPVQRVYVRQQLNGMPAEIDELSRVPVGNLVYNDGVLAIADRTTLSVFVPQEIEPRDPKAQTKRDPVVPPPQLKLSKTQPTAIPLSLPDWSLPLQRTEQIALSSGQRALFVPGFDEGFLIVERSGRVSLRLLGESSNRWSTVLPNSQASYVARHNEMFIIAGPSFVCGVSADGKRLWLIDVGIQPEMRREKSPLSAFTSAGGRLFFLQGEERLFAVDNNSGEILWSQWAIGAKLNQEAPLGHFHPRITPLGTALLVQPTPGRLWLLDTASGQRLHEESNRYEPWPRSPIHVDHNTALVVLDSRTIVLFDGRNGKTAWKHLIPQSTTLTGEAPQLVVEGSNILLLTANNLGCTLQRLDPATGKPLWAAAPLLESKTPLDAAGWSLDKAAAYYVQDQVLTARSLADGAILWRQALPRAIGLWRTRRLGDAVLAYQAETGGRRFQFRWQMFSVQWEIDHSRQVGVGRGLPVSCCDAKSGRLVQRLNLLAGPSRLRTRLGIAPSSPQDAAPQVLLTRSEVVIALDSNVWRYTPTR